VFCVEWLCTQERWDPEVVNIFGAAARYSLAKVCSSHDDAHPDNSTQHAGKICSSPLHICRAGFLLLWKRRGAAGNDMGTKIKYLRQTASGNAGIGLGTTAKYLRHTTSAAAGYGLDTTANYLPGAAGNGRAQRSSTCDALRAPPRSTAWARRSSTCDINRAAPRATAGRSDQVPMTHSRLVGLGTTAEYLRGAAGNGLGTTIKYLRGATGIGLGTTTKYLRRLTSGTAGNGLHTTAKYLVNRIAGAGNNWVKAHYTNLGTNSA
jgi:hypothetical protein